VKKALETHAKSVSLFSLLFLSAWNSSPLFPLHLKQGGGGLSNPLTTVLFSFLPMLISPTSILPCLPPLFLPSLFFPPLFPHLFLPLSILLPSVPPLTPRLSLAPVSLSSASCFPYLSAYPLDRFVPLSPFSSLPSSPTSAGPLPPGWPFTLRPSATASTPLNLPSFSSTLRPALLPTDCFLSCVFRPSLPSASSIRIFIYV
jgi:hypothetical protein